MPAEYTCFIKREDLDADDERRLRDSPHIASLKVEGDWWRVRWHNWKVLKDRCQSGGAFERAGIEVYEADVHPVRRFLTDNDVTIRRPRRCYVDVEVDSRVPVVRQAEGKSRVLCWSLVDEEGNKIYGLLQADEDEAERLLLMDLWDALLDYDQVCAWNGERYDFLVIKHRSEFLGIEIEPRRWLWLDHLVVYKRLNMNVSESGEEKESMALDRVAQAVLGRGKHELDVRDTFEQWQRDPWTLVDYNIEDAVLMRDIERETGYLELHFTVCELCSTLPDTRGNDPTNYFEGFMLKLGLEHGQHFPTKFGYAVGERYEGAYVMKPTKTGLLTDVHVCDFSALYPSIIMSWNMSPETLTDIELKEGASKRPSYLKHAPSKDNPLPANHCLAPYTEKVFRTDVKGLLPLAEERLLDLRDVWKARKNAEPPGTPKWKEADRRSGGYKIVANSGYGVQGSLFSRFYVRDVAESITQAGKFLILETHRAANDPKWGFESVYGDTDSLFVAGGSNERFQQFVDWCNAELYPRLLKERGCALNKIKLGYEKKFSRLVLMKKKRYAGRYEHYEGTLATADSRPEIKGLEYKRGDTLRLAREMQYQVVRMVLFEQVEDVEVYRDWLREWRDRILHGELRLEDVRQSNSLSKDVRMYRRKPKKNGGQSALPVHVEVALKLGEQGFDISEGVRIEYVVVDGRSPIQAVHVSEYTGEADRYYLWENLVYPPTMRVLQAAFPHHKWSDYLRVRPSRSGRPRQDNLGQTLLF